MKLTSELSTTMFLLSGVVSFLWPVSSFAEEKKVSIDLGWSNMIKNKIIAVRTFDSVSDKCWTDIEGTKAAVSLELIRSGFQIDENAIQSVDLSLIGLRITNGPCVVAIQFQFNVVSIERRFATTNVEPSGLYSYGYRTVYSNGYILTGGDMDARIVQQTQSLARNFLVEAAQAQRNLEAEIKGFGDGTEYWLNWLNAKSQ